MAQCAAQVDSLTQFTADFIRFAQAETRYHEFLSRGGVAEGGRGDTTAQAPAKQKPKPISNSVTVTCNGNISDHSTTDGLSALSALSQQIQLAREQIASSLRNKTSSSSGGVAPSDDDEMIREENLRLKQQLEQLQAQVNKLTDRVGRLESRLSNGAPAAAAPVKRECAPAPQDGEDDVDLFGDSDGEEDAEATKIKEQRLAEYAAKKSNKPQLIAKSNVILDVKPWDDETDMKALETAVRSVQMDGLLWGVSKLVPVGYGIKKLQIATVVEDEKVSIDELVDKLQEFEDFIQSVDIAAFNKI